ncbi:2-succinyl-6-hydroxy-2, 4-cyclohexadiene-1-carboxylate synthase [Clostridiales bacterium CHKCI001]|nr:2-succinyl-6-hydroxy-2, 4-cyclohexadiene-1-carboxylate synthase [Clostridiales bacterium CHKCI001]
MLGKGGRGMIKKKDIPAMVITILLIFAFAQWFPTITIVVIIILFFILLFLGNFLFEFAMWKDAKIQWGSVGNRSEKKEKAELEKQSAEKKQMEEQESDRQWIIENSGHIWIQNKREMWLHSYYMESKTQSNRYVILVHGYNGKGLDMAGMARQFYERGYHIIMPDLRAHGQSDGLARGMGWTDHFDLMEWISCIIARFPEAEIILMGISMGAATVMMAAGESLPSNVKACIEDCGYSSVWEEFESVQKEIFHLPAFPMLYVASFVCRIRAGFWLQEADCVKQIQKSKIPFLLIHGDCDHFVPFGMLQKLYHSAPLPKQKLVIQGAGHAESSQVNSELYWNTIWRFLGEKIL